MKKLLKLKELKKLFLLLAILLLISCAVKVKTVNDSFYGTQHYETDYMTIMGWFDNIKLKFVAAKNPNIILVMASYSSEIAYNISKSDNIVLKFHDNTFLNLDYINNSPTVYTSDTYYSGNSYSYGNSTSYYGTSYNYRLYTINSSARINNDIGTLTAIRIENSGGFKNLDISQSFAKKFQKAYNDIKNKINE